jgi:tetraacyldisaccharide 4'-kinase
VALERLGADCLILDDAFQHRGLARDVDIVLLDRKNPLGNGRILPAGPLREPVSALRRAGCLIATGEGDGDAWLEAHPWPGLLQKLPRPLPVFAGQRRPRDLVRPLSGEVLSLDILLGKRICAFAGIARPEAFHRSLTALGGEVAAFLTFPDHHVYTAPDRDAVKEAARKAGADLIVTTEKDAVKMASSFAFAGRLLALRIVMEIDGGPVDFARFILDAVTSWKRPVPQP